MWQRIQTLFLAISSALIIAMLFMNMATLEVPGEGLRAESYWSQWPLAVLIIITALLDIIALTTWKHRIFQFRTAGLSCIIALGLQGWIAYYFFTANPAYIFSISAVFPLVSVILKLLAMRGIWADQMIVESATRLRSARKK